MFGDPEKNPFGWDMSTIGVLISSCEAGWSGNGSQREKKDGEIAVLKVSAVTKGYFIPDECKVLDDQSNIKKYVFPQEGDLLFSRANTREMVGATAVITQNYPEYILPDKLWRIRFVDATNVWYMKYILSSKSIRAIFASVSTGTSGSMFNVSMEKFKSIAVPLPPLELQEQFAVFVTQTDKSRFIELFGDMYLNSLEWTEVSLESISDIVSGITKGRKIKTAELREVPYMAVSNVKNGYIDWTTVKTIEVTEQELNQYRLLPDDVLMTEGGDPDKVGRGAIIREPLENCIHQNHIFRVRLNATVILPEFFAEYLRHQKSKRYFLGCAKQTTGIASINMRQLKALPVLLPPLELQNQFADFVKVVDKSKAAVQKALDQAQLLFDSLMQEYFG